ncbi:MAG: hypothetical protein ABR548_00135 [Actinomycetota bacterium]|nr:hypothetical protein [Actinomycetota bacterium]
MRIVSHGRESETMELRATLCEHGFMSNELPPENRIDLSSLERLSPSAPPPRERRPILPRLTATVAFLAVASVVAAVPWFFLTRTSAPTSPLKATRPPQTASPSPSPTPSLSPGTYEVAGLTTCLRVHIEPGDGEKVLDCLGAGVHVSSDGEIREAEGRQWLHIHDPIAKVDGWAAAAYLKEV